MKTKRLPFSLMITLVSAAAILVSYFLCLEMEAVPINTSRIQTPNDKMDTKKVNTSEPKIDNVREAIPAKLEDHSVADDTFLGLTGHSKQNDRNSALDRLSNIAESDPARAADTKRAIQNEAYRLQIASDYVQDLMIINPLTALDFVDENLSLASIVAEPEPEAVESIDQMALLGEDDTDDASTFLQKGISPNDLQDLGLKLAETEALEGLLAETERLSEHPPHVRKNILYGIVEGLMVRNPELADQLVSRMQEGKVLDAAVAAIALIRGPVNRKIPPDS